MLQNAYFLAKIGADTAENEQHFAKNLPKISNYPDGSGRGEAGVLMAGSDYFCAAYTGGWADARTPHVRVADPPQ